MFEESHPLYWYHIFKPCSIIGSPSCRGDVSVVQVMYVGFMMGYILVFDEYIFLMSDEVTHIIPVTSPLDLHETMTSVFCVVEAPFLRCLSSFSCFFRLINSFLAPILGPVLGPVGSRSGSHFGYNFWDPKLNPKFEPNPEHPLLITSNRSILFTIDF